MKLKLFILLNIPFYVLILFANITNIKTICNSKKLNILFIFPIIGKHGPATLAKSYREVIKSFSKNKYMLKYYNFNIKSHVSLEYYINYANKTYNIIWFMFSDYFSELVNNKYLQVYKNTVYGPMVSPRKWFLFPQNGTYEVHWSSCVSKLLAYVVQSKRVKNHLIKHSTKINNIENKYIVSHGCINPYYSYSVLTWHERSIDILIYVKFADINKEKELQYLIKNLIISNFTVKIIRYGNHTRESLYYYSNNSKILIYFSYYDCWPSSLMEMQNQGIYPIVHQCEFIDKYGKCIALSYKEMEELIVFINSTIKSNLNPNDISSFYRNKNSCSNILKSTLKIIYKYFFLSNN